MKKSIGYVRLLSAFVLSAMFIIIVSCDYDWRRKQDNTRAKVVFEGIAVSDDESYEELAKKVNMSSVDNKPVMMIEVHSDFKGVDKPTDDMKQEEVEAILKEQRRLLKAYHTENNGKK